MACGRADVAERDKGLVAERDKGLVHGARLPASDTGAESGSLRIVRLLIDKILSEDSSDALSSDALCRGQEAGLEAQATSSGCDGVVYANGTVLPREGARGVGKMDGLNVGGHFASTLVAAHLWWRVMRVQRRRAKARADPRHPLAAPACLEAGALQELLLDVKAQRAQHLLWLLASAGADLCKAGARAGWTRGANATLSAAQVLQHVMVLMCDVRELSGVSAREGAGGDEGAEVQAAGGEQVSACLEWREMWAVACVPGDVMGADVMGRSPLHSAALAGNAGALQVLLAARANVAAQDWRGWTPLHVAANRGHSSCVQALLSFAGSLHDKKHVPQGEPAFGGVPLPQSARNLAQLVDGMGRSPLHLWSYSKHKKAQAGTGAGVSRAFKLLVLASRCVFSSELDGGWTQLHVCAAKGSSDEWLFMAQSLPEADVSLSEGSTEGRSAVAVAAATGNTAIVQAFVRHRMGPLDQTDARGRTLLDLVCFHSLPMPAEDLEPMWHAVSVLSRWPPRPSIPFVNLIHSLGDHSREGEQGSGGKGLNEVLADESLLSLAAGWGDVVTVKRLLDLRASPDSASLHVRQPSEYQSGPEGQGVGERTRHAGLPLVSRKAPLVVACRRGDQDLVRVLVQRGHARLDLLTTSCGLHAYARRSVEEGASPRAMWCERTLWSGGRETPVVTCLRHHYFDLALVLLRRKASCDVGWVRDPAACLMHQDMPTKNLSALMILMLLAPSRDASSACLSSVTCRVWEQMADAMVIHGLVTDEAVLQEGLRFVDNVTAAKHLSRLGLSVVAKASADARRARSSAQGAGRTDAASGDVLVDLLSLVCARGYSECGAGLIKGLSESSVATLRAAGRLQQPLRIAMRTGDTLMIRLLLPRICPVLPARAAHSTDICLLDLTPSTWWVRGSIARLAGEVWPQHSVLLDALQEGRWEAVVELVEYLGKLLSLSSAESGARNFAFGADAAGAQDASAHAAHLEDNPPRPVPAARATGPGREQMFGLWVKEGLVAARQVALGRTTDVERVERACAPILSLLDGLPPEREHVTSAAVGGAAPVLSGHIGGAWRFEADSLLPHFPMYEHGGGLDANSERILEAMQHVVDVAHPRAASAKHISNQVLAGEPGDDAGNGGHASGLGMRKRQTSAATEQLRQSAESHGFALALDSSTDDDGEGDEKQRRGNEVDQSTRAPAAAVARPSRRARIAAMRKLGVSRSKEAQTPLAVKRCEQARHDSLVHHQRQLVRCVAEREGLHVPLGVRILLMRRLAQVR